MPWWSLTGKSPNRRLFDGREQEKRGWMRNKKAINILEAGSPVTPEEQIWESAWDLFDALGAKASFFIYCEEMWPKKTVGSPPTDEAALSKGGVVLMHGSSRAKVSQPALTWGVHEALHYFHGPKGFRDEGTMMGLEFALYNMIKSEQDRGALLDNFSCSDDGEDEISSQVDRYGLDYFKTPVWQGILKQGQPWITKNGKVRPSVLRRLTR